MAFMESLYKNGLILRSGPEARVSKDGNTTLRPPFETQRYALLLRVR
jgi:hypothetical protein